MSKQWRLIVVCAALGLAVAAMIFLYINLSGEFYAELYTGFAIFCSPSLLCLAFSDAIKHKDGLYAIWSLIGLLNSGLCAIIGAAIAGQLRKPA
jgi:hypothetical protein